MKTVKTTERFDASGKLIERVTEVTETIELSPGLPIQYPWYVPYTVPYLPVTCEPQPAKITWTTYPSTTITPNLC